MPGRDPGRVGAQPGRVAAGTPPTLLPCPPQVHPDPLRPGRCGGGAAGSLPGTQTSGTNWGRAPGEGKHRKAACGTTLRPDPPPVARSSLPGRAAYAHTHPEWRVPSGPACVRARRGVEGSGERRLGVGSQARSLRAGRSAPLLPAQCQGASLPVGSPAWSPPTPPAVAEELRLLTAGPVLRTPPRLDALSLAGPGLRTARPSFPPASLPHPRNWHHRFWCPKSESIGTTPSGPLYR